MHCEGYQSAEAAKEELQKDFAGNLEVRTTAAEEVAEAVNSGS